MTNDVQLSAEQMTQLTNLTMARMATAGIISIPKTRRERVNWERVLVTEYCKNIHPMDPRWIRIEVGEIPRPEEGMTFARTRRYVDAIVRKPDKMLIIEAKMRPAVGAISQLVQYMDMFPNTPEFSRYKNEPLEGMLLTPTVEPDTKELAEKFGLTYETYKPSNYEAWYAIHILHINPEPKKV